MLSDDEEIGIMAAAQQAELRMPDFGAAEFELIICDFFAPGDFREAEVIELGPGQYDFARLATQRGATVTAIDHDPAVVALGRKRGHASMLGDFLELDWSQLAGKFDGLFACAAVTPQRFEEPAPFLTLIDNICSLIKPSGWGWIAPWHGPPLHARADCGAMLTAEREGFERNGFVTMELTPQEWIRYFGRYRHRFADANYIDEPSLVFLRGLRLTAAPNR